MKRTIVFLCLGGLLACATPQGEQGMNQPKGDDFLGQWDVTVQGKDGAYPSWFEITRADGQLHGRFVGRGGSARPIQTMEVNGNRLTFSLPIQYESNPEDLKFEGRLADGRIEGTTNAEDGSTLTWTAVPAPSLERTSQPVWSEPIELLAFDEWNGNRATARRPTHRPMRSLHRAMSSSACRACASATRCDGRGPRWCFGRSPSALPTPYMR